MLPIACRIARHLLSLSWHVIFVGLIANCSKIRTLDELDIHRNGGTLLGVALLTWFIGSATTWKRVVSLFDKARRFISFDRTEAQLSKKIWPSIKRISSKECWESVHRKSSATKTVSSDKPFVPLEVIAQLTLSDITHVFQHALGAVIVEPMSDSLRQVLNAMDTIAHKPKKSAQTACEEYGDMDALLFCAALRIFAEWRPLRQVPDGYKSYAMGMSLGRRDMVQNLQKMQGAIDSYPGTRATVGQMLEYELKSNIHRRLPRLKDKTFAMGFCWNLRQLKYQSSLYTNLLQVPHVHPTSQKAVSRAYQEVYRDYHGWAVKKIFEYSFQGAPPQQLVYQCMNPSLLEAVTSDAKQWRKATGSEPQLTESETSSVFNDDQSFRLVEEDDEWDTVPDVMDTSLLSELSFLSDSFHEENTAQEKQIDKKNNPFAHFGKNIARGWDKFTKDVESGWKDFSSSLVCLFNPKSRKSLSVSKRLSKENLFESHSTLDMEQYVEREMTRDAHVQISHHLKVTEPMIESLTQLLDSLNMNDPTRV